MVFSFFKKVKKTFQFKRRIDSITKIFHEFHEFFERFSEKEINELFLYRLYDHNINCIKKIRVFVFNIPGKIPNFEKKIDKNLTYIFYTNRFDPNNITNFVCS